MKLQREYLWMALVLISLLTSCTSDEERLSAQFDALPEVKSVLLYQHSSEFSGAAGRCKGTLLDRWYGTDLEPKIISELYEEHLLAKGWSIWPEEVVEIWSKEGENGLYRVHIDVFADPANISQQQGGYRFPDSEYAELSLHKTVYLLNVTYMSSSEATECFDR